MDKSMNIEHRLYNIDAKLGRSKTEMEKFTIFLAECTDLIPIDNMEQLNGSEKTITITHGKKTATVIETDNNWKSMFGLLKVTMSNKMRDDIVFTSELGLQSAISAMVLIYQKLR